MPLDTPWGTESPPWARKGMSRLEGYLAAGACTHCSSHGHHLLTLFRAECASGMTSSSKRPNRTSTRTRTRNTSDAAFEDKQEDTAAHRQFIYEGSDGTDVAEAPGPLEETADGVTTIRLSIGDTNLPEQVWQCYGDATVMVDDAVVMPR